MFTTNQFEVSDSIIQESPEQKLQLKISGNSQLQSLLFCLDSLPKHFFYIFSISVSASPEILDVKILSRSGPILYYHFGKAAAYHGVTFTSSNPF